MDAAADARQNTANAMSDDTRCKIGMGYRLSS
jgi:hypothetical protein